MMTKSPDISIAAIAKAAGAIAPVFRDTPQYFSEGLGRALGCDLICKVESINPIGSFKGRGVDWWMREQDGLEAVVCASAGNFGQAVAYSGRARGLKVHVYAAESANTTKVEAMRALGAEVHLHGNDLDDAKAAGIAFAEQEGLFFVEDGRQSEITEGAGTIAVELTGFSDPIDVIYVPVGNGALAGGVGAWFKAKSPQTRVIGVSASGASAMRQSWAGGNVVETESVTTIADGIAIRVPIPESLPPLRGTLDDFILVDDDLIIEAMRGYFTHERLIVEPAGAASLAAAIADRDKNTGKSVATLVCGSNIDPARRAEWLS